MSFYYVHTYSYITVRVVPYTKVPREIISVWSRVSGYSLLLLIWNLSLKDSRAKNIILKINIENQQLMKKASTLIHLESGEYHCNVKTGNVSIYWIFLLSYLEEAITAKCGYEAGKAAALINWWIIASSPLLIYAYAAFEKHNR